MKGGFHMDLLYRIDKKINSFFKILCSICLIICTTSVFFNTIARYFFHRPFSWSEEVSVLTMVAMVFFGQIILESENNQLNLCLLYNGLNKKMKKSIKLFCSVVTISFSIFAIYAGYNLMVRNYSHSIKTQAIHFPYWIVYLIITISFTLIIVIRLIDPFCKNTKDM